jgi:uncharacterized membrane protein
MQRIRATRGRLYFTIYATLFVTLVAIVVLVIRPGNTISVAFGLFLSWFAPGFALMSLLNPERSLSPNTVVLSVVVSYAIDIVIGLSLEVLDLGLNELGFVVGLWLVTILLLMVGAFANRSGIGLRGQAVANTTWRGLFRGVKESGLSHKAIRIHYPLYGVTIVALVSAVLLTSQVVVKAARVESRPFTALSIESLAAKAGDGHVRVVIENQENKAVVYRLELLRDGDLLEEWESIALGQHEQWALDLSSSQLVGETSFRLFVQGESQPYRQIHLTAGQSATDGSR